MTESEAMDLVQEINMNLAENGEEACCRALDMAKRALEKQMPKSPDIEGDGYDDEGKLIFDTWICPSCGRRYEIDYDAYEYCPNCGQHIDTSGTN